MHSWKSSNWNQMLGQSSNMAAFRLQDSHRIITLLARPVQMVTSWQCFSLQPQLEQVNPVILVIECNDNTIIDSEYGFTCLSVLNEWKLVASIFHWQIGRTRKFVAIGTPAIAVWSEVCRVARWVGSTVSIVEDLGKLCPCVCQLKHLHNLWDMFEAYIRKSRV